MKNKDFYSWLEQIADKKAQEWTQAPMKPLSTDEIYMEMLNDPTYNYKAFYDGQPFLANAMLYAPKFAHFNDYAKTMYHPTFSNESIYSGKVSDYNPLGIEGGSWNEEGTEYTPSMSQLANYWNYNRTRDYLDQAEDHPVKINMPAYKPGKTGNNPMSTFINDFAQKVYSGLKARNVKNIDNAYNYVMRQMAMESGYANAKSRKYHNYGGIKKGNDLKMFKDDDSFLDYYLNLVNGKYNTAINAKDLRGYVNEMGRIGYYGKESPVSYYNKINGLKSFGRLLDADLAKNKSMYNQSSGIQINPNTNQATFVQPVPADQHLAAIPFDSNYDLKTLRFPMPQLELNPTLKLPQLQPEPYDIQYDHGKSGIHINPNNRGKFNATKKRTGKTTEELSHSKNPLTRKRAIFAMNARKWKH